MDNPTVTIEAMSLNEIKNSKKIKKTVFFSSLSSVFEWYDFFLYGILTSLLSKNFFAGLSDNLAFVFALLAFSVGFVVRPFGGLLFGYLSDKYGRKSTLMVNMLLMGIPTFMVSILPTYESIGIIAPVFLIGLRVLQGIALGGAYGSLVTYISEVSPLKKRSFYGSFIQSSPTIGLLIATATLFVIKNSIGDESFGEWGWRIPFLFSTILLSLSVWIRLQFTESPIFEQLVKEKKVSKNPFLDLIEKKNLGRIGLVIGLVMGQSVSWYMGHFYSNLFLIQTLKMDAVEVTKIMIYALICVIPVYYICGHLGDRISKKWIVLSAMITLLFTAYPIFKMIGQAANPELMNMQDKQIVLKTNKSKCNSQFNPLGTATFTTGCDIAKNILAKKSVSYEVTNSNDDKTQIISGKNILTLDDISISTLDEQKQNFKDKSKLINEFLLKEGFKDKANMKDANLFVVFLGVFFLMALAAVTLSVLGVLITETFESKSRAISFSVSYNLSQLAGGFVPAMSFAIVADSGNIFYGTFYTLGIVFVACSISIFCFKTKEHLPFTT